MTFRGKAERVIERGQKVGEQEDNRPFVELLVNHDGQWETQDGEPLSDEQVAEIRRGTKLGLIPLPRGARIFDERRPQGT